MVIEQEVIDDDESFEELPLEAKLTLMKQELLYTENRFFNLLKHYFDYGYRKVRKYAYPTIKLPERQPEIFNFLLTAVALALILTPMIAGIVYLKHHRTLYHYAHTLNDLDLKELKSHWGRSHYFDPEKLYSASHETSKELQSGISDNLKSLPSHSKYVGDLGMLYRQLHKYHRNSLPFSLLDRVSDPVYNKMVDVIHAYDLPGHVKTLTHEHLFPSPNVVHTQHGRMGGKPILFPYLLFLGFPLIALVTAAYYLLVKDESTLAGITTNLRKPHYITQTQASPVFSSSRLKSESTEQIEGAVAHDSNVDNENVVLLFTNATGTRTPLAYPYDLKVETYLRMANIPYKLNSQGLPAPHFSSQSVTHKTPWIVYRGREISDAQLSIEYLKKHYSSDGFVANLKDGDAKNENEKFSNVHIKALSKSLNPREKAVARAIRVFTETRLQWPFYLKNLVYGPLDEFTDQLHLSSTDRLLYPIKTILFTRPKLKAAARESGFWNLSREFTLQATLNDLTALSNILGNKHYMMGENPCELDATVFAFLAVLYYTLPQNELGKNPLKDKFEGDCKNLVVYLERMREKYWPDWKDRLKYGGQINP